MDSFQRSRLVYSQEFHITVAIVGMVLEKFEAKSVFFELSLSLDLMSQPKLRLPLAAYKRNYYGCHYGLICFFFLFFFKNYGLISIDGVAILDSAGIAYAFAAKNRYQIELDSKQELIGLGEYSPSYSWCSLLTN